MTAREITTHITAVTVYTDRALVTRQGTIDLLGTERELLLAQLPLTLDPASVRVSGRGQVPVKLQAVTADRQYTIEPVAERIAELTAEIDRLEAEHRQLQQQINTIALQSGFIYGLCEKTETTFSRGLANQQIGLEDTQNLLDFIGAKNAEYASTTADLQQQQQEIDKRLKSLKLQLQEVETPYSRESFDLRVAIVPAGAGTFQLEVTYMVDRARWTPLYDLRVRSQERSIQLTYLAEVVQTTGEDWAGVSLTLSTAKPGLGTLPPKLDPWYIDLPAPVAAAPMMRARAVELAAAAPGGFDMLEESDAEESIYPAETEMADVSQQGSVVTFQLAGNGNIPSDGNPHQVTILDDRFPCRLEYIAMPSVVSFAYLQAKAKSRPDSATLLAGTANIFRDEMFVGNSKLDNIAPGEEFKLNLGIDEGIKIDRELTERQVDKKFLGNNRRITFGYRLTVTNLLTTPHRIQIDERIPHSRNEQIKVKLIKTTPQIPLGELSKLTWELDLPANSKTEIFYQFTIESPESDRISGLDI